MNAIRDPVQQTIRVPAGAAMVGRLMRVETQWGPPAEITFALRWETVEVDGTSTPIELKPSRRVQPTHDTRGGLRQRGIEIELPLPGEERYQIYHVNGDHGVLDSGFRSEWVTAKP